MHDSWVTSLVPSTGTSQLSQRCLGRVLVPQQPHLMQRKSFGLEALKVDRSTSF